MALSSCRGRWPQPLPLCHAHPTSALRRARLSCIWPAGPRAAPLHRGLMAGRFKRHPVLSPAQRTRKKRRETQRKGGAESMRQRGRETARKRWSPWAGESPGAESQSPAGPLSASCSPQGQPFPKPPAACSQLCADYLLCARPACWGHTPFGTSQVVIVFIPTVQMKKLSLEVIR